MNWPDILELQKFYTTRLGRLCQINIREKILEFWRDKKNKQILGIGYTYPFLKTYKDKNSVVLDVPFHGGVVRWPERGKNLTCTSHELELPFANESFDFILIAHALEHTGSSSGFMQEIWRILAPNGKIILIVPNRSGIWAHTDNTPFGHGKPYSINQLNIFLEGEMFKPLKTTTCLFFPPTRNRLIKNSLKFLNSIGKKIFKNNGGIIICEAKKEVYSLTGMAETADVKKSIMRPTPAMNFERK